MAIIKVGQVKSQEDLDLERLAEIDRIAGPRMVREALLASGQRGFGNKIETLEAEASAIRARKK